MKKSAPTGKPAEATAADLTARVTRLEETVRLLTARLDTFNDRPAAGLGLNRV